MNPGKVFEQEVKDSIANDVYYMRIKDPAASFGQDSSKTRFSSHNEFDALMYKSPNFIVMELKSNSGTSISFSLTSNKGTNIKKCQIEGLTRAHNFGIRAGLLLNFRKYNKTYWIDIPNFLEFSHNTTKKSINIKDIIEYGGILVPQKLKKVRYIYDLNFLFREMSDIIE